MGRECVLSKVQNMRERFQRLSLILAEPPCATRVFSQDAILPLGPLGFMVFLENPGALSCLSKVKKVPHLQPRHHYAEPGASLAPCGTELLEASACLSGLLRLRQGCPGIRFNF